MMFFLIFAFSLQSNKLIIQDFELQKTNQESFFDLYGSLMNRGSDIIITSDLFFHSSISLYESVITQIEEEKLIPELKELLNQLTSRAEGISKEYFEVALSLLKGDKSTSRLVLEEIQKIKSARGFEHSEILGVEIDYSQFKPRGHYTKSEILKDYFRTVMWLSFPKIPLELDKYYNLAKTQATLLQECGLISKYKEIDSLISKLVGTTDDITPLLILRFKDTPSPIDSLKNFQARVVPKMEEKTVKYSFFPQRFVLDSYILQKLTYGNVVGYKGVSKELPFTAAYTLDGIQRVFPRGLDVFSVLGSSAAAKILKRDGDTDYSNYAKMHGYLKKEIELNEEGSLYDIYLCALSELLSEKDFVSQSYQYKNLLTALGGWTELRHQTILYAKQSYTSLAALPLKKKKVILIEPFPEVYRYLLKFTREMEEFYPSKSISEFASIMENVIQDSEEELNGKIPEQTSIKSIPSKLRKIVGNKKAPIVADVHTDSNTGAVLEEAIGNPFIVRVFLNINRKNMDLIGVGYSYYEFKQPMENRLSDEEWEEMKNREEPSTWIKSFIK